MQDKKKIWYPRHHSFHFSHFHIRERNVWRNPAEMGIQAGTYKRQSESSLRLMQTRCACVRYTYTICESWVVCGVTCLAAWIGHQERKKKIEVVSWDEMKSPYRTCHTLNDDVTLNFTMIVERPWIIRQWAPGGKGKGVVARGGGVVWKVGW